MGSGTWEAASKPWFRALFVAELWDASMGLYTPSLGRRILVECLDWPLLVFMPLPGHEPQQDGHCKCSFWTLVRKLLKCFFIGHERWKGENINNFRCLPVVGFWSSAALDGSLFREQHTMHIPCMQRFTGGVIFTFYRYVLFIISTDE